MATWNIVHGVQGELSRDEAVAVLDEVGLVGGCGPGARDITLVRGPRGFVLFVDPGHKVCGRHIGLGIARRTGSPCDVWFLHDRHGTVEELIGVRIEPTGRRVILPNDWNEDHLSKQVRVNRGDGDYYYASIDGWTQRYNSALGLAGLPLRQDRAEVRLSKFSGVLADGKPVESEAGQSFVLGQFLLPKKLSSWPTLPTSTPRLAPAVTVRRRPPVDK